MDPFKTNQQGSDPAGQPLQGGQKPRLFHTMSIFWLIFSPWLMFVLISGLFTFAYHVAPSVVWVGVILCIGISALFMAVRPRKQGGPMYWLLLGIICMFAVLIGTLGGFWNYNRNMATFTAYEDSRTYTNVLPSDAALAHLDAGSIVYSVDSKLDLTKTIGYSDGDRYCVAPIIGDKITNKIEYWAAGKNCCAEKGDFKCDSFDNAKAHSGLVYLDASSLMSYPVPQFAKAVKLAMKEYNLDSSTDAIFVKWVDDVEEAQMDWWNHAVGFFVGTSAVHLGFSALLGLTLHLGSRSQKMKDPARSSFRG